MTEEELQKLFASVEELKRAVSRNNPELRAIMSPQGWVPMSLIAGVGIGLFCLPAQVLAAAYGSFESVPAPYRAALWCVFALVIVLSAVWKLILFARKSREASPGESHSAALSAFMTGRNAHIIVPYLIVIMAAPVFLVWKGHPWYIASVVAIATCFWSNHVSTQVDRPEYTAAGWWCLVTGLASLFVIEKSPFLWLFVIYGGLCFVFAGMLMLSWRRDGQRAA